MKSKGSLFLFLLISFSLPLLLTPTDAENSAFAASEDGSGDESKGGFWEGVADVLGNAAKEAAEEGMDEFLGTYMGRIGEVKLLEHRGNTVVLEVRYENIKRSDGVYVKGQVLRSGEPLEGFTSTVTQVSGKEGKAVLSLRRTREDDDPWGVSAETEFSDQIKLFLIRESKPDHPFGFLVYDFPKTWTDSDAMEETAAESASSDEDDQSIQLAEDESLEAGDRAVDQSQQPIKVGTVLEPVQVARVPAKAATQTPSTEAGISRPASAKITAKPVRVPAATRYDFYTNASKARWRAGRNRLPCPGSVNDKRGFVRQVPQGKLSTGNKAVKMLQTHPERVSNGWVAGIYPKLVPAEGVHFKAVVGFLEGAAHSDGVTFMVQVYEKGRYTRILSKTLRPDKYAAVDAYSAGL